MDFFGLNYYKDGVRFKGFQNLVMPNTPRNDLGWEIYPKGLYRLCKLCYERYRVPVWITENGTCDEEDRFRSRYIYDHLLEISKLCSDGIPVERYYHWSLMDNFEWAEGDRPDSASSMWIMIPKENHPSKRPLLWNMQEPGGHGRNDSDLPLRHNLQPVSVRIFNKINAHSGVFIADTAHLE